MTQLRNINPTNFEILLAKSTLHGKHQAQNYCCINHTMATQGMHATLSTLAPVVFDGMIVFSRIRIGRKAGCYDLQKLIRHISILL